MAGSLGKREEKIIVSWAVTISDLYDKQLNKQIDNRDSNAEFHEDC